MTKHKEQQYINIEPEQSACSSKEFWSLQPVTDWLFRQGRLVDNRDEFVSQLARQLTQSGAPLDRMTLMFPTINPLFTGTSVSWSSDTDKTIHFQARHGVKESERFVGSPLQKLLESGRGVRQSILELPDDAHNAYLDLKRDGYVDYYAMPVTFNTGLNSAFIVVTRASGGFRACDIDNFRLVRDFIAPTLEVFSLRQLSKSLMDTYVGKRTSEKVLSGMVKRGDADTIHAALWFSDLRDFTQLTEDLPADKLLKMLNDYFEFVAAAVTAYGGEILRFIGDAMLIVFPIDDQTSPRSACRAALEAAYDAQQSLAALNHMRRRHNEAEIRFGVGLNVGEVIYGNVGAPDRLDFTVMGPAVNRTARLESLTKDLGVNILISREFSRLVDRPSKFLGDHLMKGITKPQSVFTPDINEE
ncbi:MAG: adenylate/guanylate cyclase domain-containing protein [Gammaproteobacteria bacterium]|nr:adenylate/guanylate cyclase domain-containing protein [Gammaproteobacteria bacterium]